MYWQVWLVYLIAAVGVTVLWWRFTGKMNDGFIRRVLRLVVAIILFVPAQSVPASPDLAPAFIVALFASLTGDQISVQAGLVPLTIGGALMLSVVAITSLVQRIRGSAAKVDSTEVDNSAAKDNSEAS
ncbi:MAG: hypothetical protein ACI90U_001702 [Pseudomonadales bacterium]|jgi:hypothetical protein